ncbi:hypothetical protein niasHT_002219 [Heterodera trifolii]|uniref:Uncharacterized protein n=1 Tax=Heterodera trifolii TaxID=157864 RepID=A0ABD2LS69_9BILA
MPRLNCMVDKICAKKDEKGLVHKLKRRFALFAKMDLQELECWELHERLAKLKVAKKKKPNKVERFEADFGKAMMTNGPVFVEDFIKAILL